MDVRECLTNQKMALEDLGWGFFNVRDHEVQQLVPDKDDGTARGSGVLCWAGHPSRGELLNFRGVLDFEEQMSEY